MSWSNQEEVSLHGGVPGSQHQDTSLPDELIGGVHHVLLLTPQHLVDLQQLLQILLEDNTAERRMLDNKADHKLLFQPIAK